MPRYGVLDLERPPVGSGGQQPEHSAKGRVEEEEEHRRMERISWSAGESEFPCPTGAFGAQRLPVVAVLPLPEHRPRRFAGGACNPSRCRPLRALGRHHSRLLPHLDEVATNQIPRQTVRNPRNAARKKMKPDGSYSGVVRVPTARTVKPTPAPTVSEYSTPSRRCLGSRSPAHPPTTTPRPVNAIPIAAQVSSAMRAVFQSNLLTTTATTKYATKRHAAEDRPAVR
jgi:hypothetical protein